MKRYIGIKTVYAERMNEQKAIEKGYARKQKDPKVFRCGYWIRYLNPDGTKYDSWSPVDVFERDYQLADTPADELMVELNELSKKIEKLHNRLYLHCQDDVTANLMSGQLQAMIQYKNILVKRIEEALDNENK